MTLVCPTLRTVAVGVTRAGRHDGGSRPRGWQSNERSRGCAPTLWCRKEEYGSAALWLELRGIRFAFSVIRPMARLLLRLPTRASHYNMAIKPMESGAGKLRGRDHDDMLCR